MTTPTTLHQAKNISATMFQSDPAREVIESLAQQVEALTADLAAEKLFSKQAMDSVTEIAAQRDDLKTENANLLAANRYSQNVEQEAMSDLMAMTVERDALRTIIVDSVAALGTAARVSQTSSIEFLQDVPGEIRKTMEALKPDAKLYRHLRDHFAKNLENAREEFARLEPLTGAEFDAVVRASIDAMGVEA